MKRAPQPELLDSLPPNDPRAIESRRDLRWLNAIMGHRLIFQKAILRDGLWNGRNRIGDIGAGDGSLLFHLAKKLPGGTVRATLIDRQKLVTDSRTAAFRNRGWAVSVIEADVFEWAANQEPASRPFDWILTNLFLHHFSDSRLERLFKNLAGQTHCFLACEPERGFLAKFGARCVGLLGCNAVTRHDAKVSVEAGFRNQELSCLWPDAENWTLTERRAGPFTHFFCARRRTDSSTSITRQ